MAVIPAKAGIQDKKLYPNIILRSHFTTRISGIYCTGWFNQHDLAFFIGKGFVLDAFWNNKHLSGL